MSNPGVIVLSNDKIGSKHFQIEDNIGEAIHIHFEQFRLDLSIAEFLNLTNEIESSIRNLDILKNINFKLYDPSFLYESSNHMHDLVKVEEEEVKLKDLTCIKREKLICNRIGIQKEVRINETPAFKYLIGKKSDLNTYNQTNYYHQNNESRLIELKNSIMDNGYQDQKGKIVLFGSQNCIRDGQHRAAILLNLHGKEFMVKVHRFIFKKDISVKFDNYKTISAKIFRKIVRKLANDFKLAS